MKALLSSCAFLALVSTAAAQATTPRGTPTGRLVDGVNAIVNNTQLPLFIELLSVPVPADNAVYTRSVDLFTGESGPLTNADGSLVTPGQTAADLSATVNASGNNNSITGVDSWNINNGAGRAAATPPWETRRFGGLDTFVSSNPNGIDFILFEQGGQDSITVQAVLADGRVGQWTRIVNGLGPQYGESGLRTVQGSPGANQNIMGVAWKVSDMIGPDGTPLPKTTPLRALRFSQREQESVPGADPLLVAAVIRNAPAATVLNLSTRALVGRDNSVFTTGFVINSPTPRRVLIRGVGPTLNSSLFGIPGRMVEDPAIELLRGTTVIASNDNWDSAGAAQLNAAAASVGAFPLLGGSRDAALRVELTSGSYTVRLRSASGELAPGLLEVYDLEPPSAAGQLINISTRAEVQTGENVMIPGLVLRGTAARRVLFRAVGPSLSGAPFNLTNTLPQPRIELYRGTQRIASNDNWESHPAATVTEIRQAAQRVGAFDLRPGARDAALLLNVEPGIYTLVVSGVGAATGICLAEMYVVD